jgi:threonine aldolase
VTTIELRSDNAAGVTPSILDAVVAANHGSALAYGDDPVTAELEATVRRVFEHATARVFPVTSGTAANSLALSALCPPWGAVLCHETAHVLNSEGGATSLLGGGAVMRGVAGDEFKVDPSAFEATLASVRWGDPHHSQPAVLSLTQATDMGTIYSVDHVAELAAIAHGRGLRVHLDGARIANSIAALGCSPAELTWRAGVDAVSLGATKNGALSAEAIVVFDHVAADELVYRTKRAGHVTSKMRFQSAQLIAYLTDDAWLHTATHANARMAQLAEGLRSLGIKFVTEPAVNMLFAEVPDHVMTKLETAGLLFYRMGPDRLRLVTSWQTTPEEIDQVIERFAAAVPGSGRAVSRAS